MPGHPCQGSLWIQLIGKPDQASNAKAGGESQVMNENIIWWPRGQRGRSTKMPVPETNLKQMGGRKDQMEVEQGGDKSGE